VNKECPGAYVTITERRVSPDDADCFLLNLNLEALNA
jgi:hypothetical protein